MQKSFDGLLVIVGLGALITFIVILLPHALDRQAVADCTKWESYSKEYTNFYLTKSEDSECRAVGIIINAPVR